MSLDRWTTREPPLQRGGWIRRLADEKPLNIARITAPFYTSHIPAIGVGYYLGKTNEGLLEAGILLIRLSTSITSSRSR